MIAFTRKTDKHFLKARTLKLSPSLSPSSPPPQMTIAAPSHALAFHMWRRSLGLASCCVGCEVPAAWESKGSPGGTRRSGREAYLLPSTQPCSALYYIFPAHTYTHMLQRGISVGSRHRNDTCGFCRSAWRGTQAGLGHKLAQKLAWDTKAHSHMAVGLSM